MQLAQFRTVRFLERALGSSIPTIHLVHNLPLGFPLFPDRLATPTERSFPL
jgi:hypothetical protein